MSDNPIGASYLYLTEPEIRFLEHDVRVVTRVRDQRFLASDGLAVHRLPADHLARHRERQRGERIRRRHRGRVGTEAPMQAAVTHKAQRRHVEGFFAVDLQHQRALDRWPRM